MIGRNARRDVKIVYCHYCHKPLDPDRIPAIVETGHPRHSGNYACSDCAKKIEKGELNLRWKNAEVIWET